MTTATSTAQRPTAKAKKALIKVIAVPGTSDPVDFTMDAKFPDSGGKQDQHKLKFDAHAGPFELTFTLDDRTPFGLAFYPDFADAMWVAVGSACPTGPGDGAGAIGPVEVTGDQLVVTNHNAVEETLTFALRFSGRAAGKCPPFAYDPQIANGGGSIAQA